jgi:hypothetical protein
MQKCLSPVGVTDGTRATSRLKLLIPSGVPTNFVRGGFQQIQLRTEGRKNGDLGAVAP